MPFAKPRAKRPSRRPYRRFRRWGRRKLYPKKALTTNFFSIQRWSVRDGGIWQIAQQIAPNTPIVPAWNINQNGEYVMRFIYKTFSLNDLPNFNELTNLFNWYTIKSVKVCISFTWERTGADQTSPPASTAAGGPTALTNYKPQQEFRVCSFIDKTNRIRWDDEDPQYLPNSEAQAKQFVSYREHISYNRNFTRMVRPRPLGVVENQNAQPIFGAQSNMKWLATNNVTTPWYGFVCGVVPVAPYFMTLANKYRIGYSINCQYHVILKGTR